MKKLSLFFVLISLSIFFIFSCKKEKNDVATVDYGSSNNSLKTTVTGIVLDESNAPLTGVTVTAYGQTTATNQYGTFVLKDLNVNKERCVLQFVKTGFFKRSHGFIAAGNTVNYVRIILLSNAATQNFSSSAGGTISLPDGSSAEFQPNSFVTSNGSAYTGTVNLIVKHLSPDDVNFGFTIPGGDLAGVNASNENVVLYTYGMLGVELTGSSGEALQLANGTSATLTLSIAASQLATAPATIPLWFFDETTSLWKEEGSAAKVGNNYVGTVAHFSWWNCDYQGPRAYLKGKVVDCNGAPLPNIIVTANGWFNMITNQNGEYIDAVPCGMTFTIQVLSGSNGGAILSSQLENIPALSNNQIYIVPDLVVPCPTRIAGTIKTCSGENTYGFISLSGNSGFFVYQYVVNGIFNMPVVANTLLELKAHNGIFSYNQPVTSLSSSNILNVGNLFLCDSLSTSVSNSFTLNGGPFTNQLISLIDSNQAEGQINSGVLIIQMNGSTSSGYYIADFFSQSPGILGSGTFYSFDITLENSSLIAYHIQMNSAPLSVVTIQIDPLGGQIKGTYSGNCLITTDSTTYQGYISGSFDVVRTQ